MARPKKSCGAKLSELQHLQKVVATALIQDIEQSMGDGELNQGSVRNALQLLRDNNVVCIDDLVSDVERLTSLLPPLDLTVSTTLSKYDS